MNPRVHLFRVFKVLSSHNADLGSKDKVTFQMKA